MANHKEEKEITGMLAYVICAREMQCVSVHSKCLLQYYASNCGRDGSFFKSMLDICAETGLSESFVRKTNADWKKKGIISWAEGDWTKGLANQYQLNLVLLKKICAGKKNKIDEAKNAARAKATARQQRCRARRAAAENPEHLPESVTPWESVTNDNLSRRGEA